MSTNIEPSTVAPLRIIETKPAVVNFNYEEISNHLDSVLDRYRGLVFTESTVADCKKTIAELRKGQKSLDEFRKATKKQLTESVTNFEFQCKVLYDKFAAVIKPLTEQQDQFELDRREKKRAEIQSIIDALIVEYGLSEKYALQLVIPEEYYNKGKAIKAIKTELSALANTLKVQQDKEAQDIDLIKTKVQLANVHYQLTNELIPYQYIRFLAYNSVADIESMIITDAQGIADRERKAAEESNRAAEAHAQELLTKVAEASKVEEVHIGPTKQIEYTPDPALSKRITAVYEITGTEEQLSALEAYLDANNYVWVDRPNE